MRQKQLPLQRNKGIIYPMYKTGDTSKCNNCKPVTLLNIASTIFAVLLNKRLSDLVKKLEECRMEFSSNKIYCC